MRERLIELLNYIPCKAESCAAVDGGRCGDLDNLNRCQIEAIAEYLLANGVILPPCKVGDAVYIVDRTSDSVVNGIITHFEYNLYTTPKEWITVVSNELWYGKTKIRNRIDLLIGETVFFTREDAERALRKEDEGK